jgi:hypothetical protein
VEAALPDPGGADHRAQIPEEIVGVAHVDGDHREHVLPQGTRVIELERRDAQPLLPDLRGPRVVRAVRGAPDVALMRAVDRPERDLVVHEDGYERGEVGQVVVAVVGIVEEEDVTGLGAPDEGVADRLHRPRDRPHVDRHVLGLGHEARARIADRRREVSTRVQDLGVRGAEHRLPHLLHDGFEAVREHGHGDGIDQSRPLRRLHGQRPCQSGLRFSRKARTPSWKSRLR